LQLRGESGLFFGLLAFISVDRHFPPSGFCIDRAPSKN
jgi:hypothetical protein